jgi:hypothetical protein
MRNREFWDRAKRALRSEPSESPRFLASAAREAVSLRILLLMDLGAGGNIV